MEILSHYIDPYDNNKFIKEYPTYIHAHGGDGTLIKAVAMHRDKNKPFFGSAAGTVNFMMNPEQTISEDATTITLHTIHSEVTFIENGVEKVETAEAFNEVAIGGDMNSWISFSVDNPCIGDFKGGGIIFSTAQGSTSMNLNNYGRILPLSSKVWSITGNMTNREINNIKRPKKTTIKVESRNPVSAWMDGANNHIVRNVKSVTISQGRSVQVIFNDIEEFKRKRVIEGEKRREN